jgi:arylsulfatase A-like enzyme
MNVILLIIDTLRYDHIAASVAPKGNTPSVRTPNLDRLVARSWNYHRAFAASFPTIPHRNDVIRGRYGAPFHPWQPLDCDVPNIPQVLRTRGYCSQLIHDTPHLVNGGHRFDYPFDAWTPIRGAEVDRSWISDSWDYMENWAPDPLFDGYPLEGEDLLRAHHAITCYVQTNRGRAREQDWNVAKLFTTAARFLHDNKTRDNFFLWLDCFDPHEPWDSPPEYVRMYDRTPGYDGRIDPRAFHYRNAPDLSETARQRVIGQYKAKVTLVDRWFGVLLDALDETGLARNTALVLTADHGTNVGDRRRSAGRQPDERGHFGKASPPRENESHVPFVVYAPEAGAGESDTIVQPQDIFRTVMALAGHEDATPVEIESYDVLKLARQGGGGGRDLALGGSSVGSWDREGDAAGRDEVLFSAFDGEWRLGVAANPAACELERLGTPGDVAAEHPVQVEQLRAAAIDEIARRGLDPALVTWLRAEGEIDFPQAYRVTDANPLPPGWRNAYWLNMHETFNP